MFSQLFGNYLVNKGIITKEDYQKAIDVQLEKRVRIGEIAVAEGMLTPEQVSKIKRLQKQFDALTGRYHLQIFEGFLPKH